MERANQGIDDVETRCVGCDKSSGLVTKRQLAQRSQSGSRALPGKGIGGAVTFDGVPSPAPLLGHFHEDTDCTESRIPVMVDHEQNAQLARRVGIRVRLS